MINVHPRGCDAPSFSRLLKLVPEEFDEFLVLFIYLFGQRTLFSPDLITDAEFGSIRTR